MQQASPQFSIFNRQCRPPPKCNRHLPNFQFSIVNAVLTSSSFRSNRFSDIGCGVRSSWAKVGSDPIRMLPVPDPIPDEDDQDALMAAAKAITEAGDEYQRWSEIVAAEREQLVFDLKQAGFWSDAQPRGPR